MAGWGEVGMLPSAATRLGLKNESMSLGMDLLDSSPPRPPILWRRKLRLRGKGPAQDWDPVLNEFWLPQSSCRGPSLVTGIPREWG